MSVNLSARSGGKIEISFRISFKMKVYYVFSLKSPHRGDSNEYAQYTIFNIKLQLWDFSQGLKNEFEIAVVNEPLVFEPLKFYCICFLSVGL